MTSFYNNLPSCVLIWLDSSIPWEKVIQSWCKPNKPWRFERDGNNFTLVLLPSRARGVNFPTMLLTKPFPFSFFCLTCFFFTQKNAVSALSIMTKDYQVREEVFQENGMGTVCRLSILMGNESQGSHFGAAMDNGARAHYFSLSLYLSHSLSLSPSLFLFPISPSFSRCPGHCWLDGVRLRRDPERSSPCTGQLHFAPWEFKACTV